MALSNQSIIRTEQTKYSKGIECQKQALQLPLCSNAACHVGRRTMAAFPPPNSHLEKKPWEKESLLERERNLH
jgi:hypothetical protein